METYFYCLLTYKDGIQSYSSGSLDVIANGDKKKLVAEAKDAACESLGLDKDKTVLISLSKL